MILERKSGMALIGVLGTLLTAGCSGTMARSISSVQATEAHAEIATATPNVEDASGSSPENVDGSALLRTAKMTLTYTVESVRDGGRPAVRRATISGKTADRNQTEVFSGVKIWDIDEKACNYVSGQYVKPVFIGSATTTFNSEMLSEAACDSGNDADLPMGSRSRSNCTKSVWIIFSDSNQATRLKHCETLLSKIKAGARAGSGTVTVTYNPDNKRDVEIVNVNVN